MQADPDPTEGLLRDLRPQPRADFVRNLEASLQARSHRRGRWQVLVAAGALSVSLAAVTLVLSVAGLLPWRVGESSSVKAGSGCKTVVVVHRERRPVLVVRADGKITTERNVVEVRRPVKRCP
jgi:hypothetical protein